MSEKIKYPNFKKITNLSKKKIKQKFGVYGNSWISERNFNFWFQRLDGEIHEIKKAENSAEREKEIIDAINILAMMYENNHKLIREEAEIYRRTWRYG